VKRELKSVVFKLTNLAKQLKTVRKGGLVYMGPRQWDVNQLLPHIGMAVLVILVLAGSLIGPKTYFPSYASLQQSILDPEEIKVIAISLDKYTPFIDESESDFILGLHGAPLAMTTAQGYIDQPQIALAAATNTDGIKDRDDLVSRYTVQNGDTISSIALKFGISVNTLRWANQISNLDYVKPNQRLIIPERNGVWHTVAKGESLLSLIKKFNGNLKATLAFNGLGKGNSIYQNQKLLIVGGKKVIPQVASAATYTTATSPYASASSSSQPKTSYSGRSSYNRFPYGWCTWYAASRRNVPWSGNAGTWLYNARAMGYPTGSAPRAGSIMVSCESPVGHVAYVEAVYGNSFKISEMNYGGWGVVSTRIVPAGAGFVWGFIY